MQKVFSLLMLLAICGLVQGQKVNGIIKGKVTDSTGKEPLADATVSVLLLKDSSLVSYVLSGKEGSFEIKNLAAGSYSVFISYQGLKTYNQDFIITSENNAVDIGLVKLEKDYRPLEEIIVTSDPPIMVKGDTVQFRANAFKTPPNSTAENLLKMLPGMEVDKEGNVKAQGEDVIKIYVDGKEFFGSDPRMATKNITTDMIESIQLYDEKSEQSTFTGIDDGSRSKTINIKLKKDRNQGYFGRATAGAGNNGRYDGSVSVNRFINDRRVTFTGSSSNSNQRGINLSNIGNYGSFGGTGSLSRASSAGINYNDKLGRKINVSASYFYAGSDSRNQQTSFRETTFLNDSLTNQNSLNSSANNSGNHQFSLHFDYMMDTLNSLSVTSGGSIQNSNGTSGDASSILAITPGLKYLANTTASRYTNERDGTSVNNSLSYRHRFRKRGRTFSLGLNHSVNNSQSNGSNISPITFYNPDGSVERIREQNFMNSQFTKSYNAGLNTSYTEPIGKNKVLEFNYSFTSSHSISDRDAFDYNFNSKEFDVINRQQTNYSSSDIQGQRAGTNFRFQAKKYSLQIGGSLQNSDITNKSVRGIYNTNGKDSTIITRQNYTNLFPTANFMYNISKSKNIQVGYSGRTNQPWITQLEAVLDFTNPLLVRSGNPALLPEFTNNFNLSYRTSNLKNYRYFSVMMNGSKTANRIVNSIDSLPKGLVSGPDSSLRGVQFIRPVNLNGTFNGYINATVGIPFKKKKGGSINFSNSIGYNRNVSMLYKRKNFTNSLSVSQSLGLNLNIKEKLNVGLRASASYSNVSYSFEESRNRDTKYFSQTYSTNINYYFKKAFILFFTTFDYRITSGRKDGYNQAIPSWNVNASKQLFKKKNGEIRLSISDLLNKNQSINRVQGENYFYDSRSVVLKRYFLITFTYNIFKGTKRGVQRVMPPQRGPGGFHLLGD